MKSEFSFLLALSVLLLFSSACSDDSAAPSQLVVVPAEILIPARGGNIEFIITSNGKWHIEHSGRTWLNASQPAGDPGTTTIDLYAGINATGITRNALLIVTADNGQARRVPVSQQSVMYPSYNTSPKPPDATGMSSTAVGLAAKMNLGWNLGNTFEAPGGEQGWGSPVITEDYIKFVKQSGFNAIRIPCAWDWHHIDDRTTAKINEGWLARVKEVVGYCVANDMYVLLNIHWDGGWLENNCTPEKQDSVNAKQKAYWEQIATVMRDFDEHVMFASANEPNAGNLTEMEVLLSYHQTFVDAVRSTGGRNTYRVLVIQGSSDLLTVSDFPDDPTPDRLMFEEHNYTPFQFTLMNGDASWGKMFYYWGEGHHSEIEPGRNPDWGEEDVQIEWFDKMKTQFIDKGIPVIMGEYGAYRRTGSSNVPLDTETHNDAVDYWVTFVTRHARERGIIPFWWDTGGALDRTGLFVSDQRTIDAIIAGSK